MAIAFAAAIFRSQCGLRVLARVLILAWPLGVFLAGLESYQVHLYWKGGLGCIRYSSDIVGCLSLVICFTICLISYICSAVRSRKAGRAVQLRIWNRANLYIVVAIVTLGPNAYRIISNGWSSRLVWRICDLLILVLFGLNGLLNALVYALQNRYVKRIHRSYQSRALDDNSTGTGSSQHHAGSFHVTFEDKNVDVHEVVQVQAEAMRTAEAEVQRQEQLTQDRVRVYPPDIPLPSASAHNVAQMQEEMPDEGQAPVGSWGDSHSEMLLGCFDLLADGEIEEPNIFPVSDFIVGSPPDDCTGRAALVAPLHAQDLD